MKGWEGMWERTIYSRIKVREAIVHKAALVENTNMSD
jgi:hypothetical protein